MESSKQNLCIYKVFADLMISTEWLFLSITGLENEYSEQRGDTGTAIGTLSLDTVCIYNVDLYQHQQ